MKIAIFRKASFCAAHRLNNPAWSIEKNRQIFGLCNNPHYHGHNYELVVKLIGEIDPETGFLMNLELLNALIEREVIQRFDHKNLNIECPEFAQLNPTVEHIAIVIWQVLRAKLKPEVDLHIRLYETALNYVEYPVP